MAKYGSRTAPANMFELDWDEGYAGISKADWVKIIHHLEFFKPVKLDDIEPEDRECSICRQSFCPTDDGQKTEIPISLPCNHVFGMDCLMEWINIDHPEAHDNVSQEPPREVSSINSFSLADIDHLQPQGELDPFPYRSFSCPSCRRDLAFQRYTEAHAVVVETRLKFWDSCYEKIGCQRSVEEQVCRDELWQFVHETKREMTPALRRRLPWLYFHARISAMRFALRRGQWDHLTPVQRALRDALFNVACCGVDDPDEPYRAESYDDRTLPVWCWQFEQIERRLHPMLFGIEKRGEGWETQTLGEWRRKLFADITEVREEYGWNWFAGH